MVLAAVRLSAAQHPSPGRVRSRRLAVDLVPLRDPTLVLPTIARTLGVLEAGRQPLLQRLQRYLRERSLLLVLDNFEHLLAAAPDIAQLLTAIASLKILVTSREPLRLRLEYRFLVTPLAVPDLHGTPELETAKGIASVALFVQRARMVNPGFTFTQANARAVAELCVRLDGLPLAIELAAAHSNVLAPAALLARLERHLPLPTWGAADVPARHQTLQAAIASSYEILSPEEQALFRRLGVFVGGWTLEALGAVASDLEGDLLAPLTALVDKSLVQAMEPSGGEVRFRMLETIREYALAQLAAQGEPETTRRRHAEYFLALAERADPALTGPDQAAWTAQLEREHDNLRAALRWATEQRESGLALRLAAALGRFWWMRGYAVEGSKWLADALARSDGAPPAVRAGALSAAGALAHAQGDYERARTLHEEALALWRALGDHVGLGRSLTNLGIIARLQGAYERAEDLLGEGLTLCRAAGDTWGTTLALNNLGMVARLQGNYQRALSRLEESLTLCRTVGDPRSAAIALSFLAETVAEQGDRERATALLAEGLALARDLGDGLIGADAALVAVKVVLGRRPPEELARLLGVIYAMCEAMGLSRLPFDPVLAERMVAPVREQLGRERFAAAWGEGRALSTLTLDQLVEQALAVLEQPALAAPLARERGTGRPPALVLSERERQVLRMVAAGLPNKQIARELGIAERTVKAHLTMAMNKLGADNRAQVAVLASQLGIL